jgi:hypothetical protein
VVDGPNRIRKNESTEEQNGAGTNISNTDNITASRGIVTRNKQAKLAEQSHGNGEEKANKVAPQWLETLEILGINRADLSPATEKEITDCEEAL